ncbi:DUF6074 family protein [Brucella pseudintermedia]|uniref:DUF6074 family protein n=1 Tax=Brucella pseudintermedia TaxID=370111 RepID=UPI00124E4EB6|nr:DUF6074 family protein [Brucella pseudintermedia]KAB2681383.1 hypothetical protein F9K78_14535 [Brucella pseudintermedia]
MTQLDFFDSLDQPVPAPVAHQPEPMAGPEPRGQIIAFPMTHHVLVQQTAAVMRSLRDDDLREAYFKRRMVELFRARQMDGLSREEARDDVQAAWRAIRAEYRRPSPPPARWRDHNSLVSFPERSHDRQTA